jgi:hypothetical protein
VPTAKAGQGCGDPSVRLHRHPVHLRSSGGHPQSVLVKASGVPQLHVCIQAYIEPIKPYTCITINLERVGYVDVQLRRALDLPLDTAGRTRVDAAS